MLCGIFIIIVVFGILAKLIYDEEKNHDHEDEWL